MNFRTDVSDWLAPHLQLPSTRIRELLETPPETVPGDLALPCFLLAREQRRDPRSIAMSYADIINGRLLGNPEGSPPAFPLLARAEAVQGYVNLFFNQAELVDRVLGTVLREREHFGSSCQGAGKRILLDFSSPNIAKPFHMGHLCSTVIGNSLERIHRHLGYDTVKINHLGDWGTQFGKLIVGFRRWGDEEALEAHPIREMLRVYVHFHAQEESEPDMAAEARSWFRRLEEGDHEALGWWTRFSQLSLVDFDRIYKTLGISFDQMQGESFYQDKMAEIVSMLDEKGLLEESEGARVVSLSDENLPPCLIEKSDGGSTYATRDLSAALFRHRTYGFDQLLYVVGTPQVLHFQQVFAVLRKAGFAWADACQHVGFGLVKFADRKMSTRKGDIIYLEEVLEESVRRSREKMLESRGAFSMDPEAGKPPQSATDSAESNPAVMLFGEGEDELTQTASLVGVGAIVYAFLKNGRDRDIVFSWEDMLDFDGDSGPYIQYTHARTASLLRKAQNGRERMDAKASFPISDTSVPFHVISCEPHEINLLRQLADFGDCVTEAAAKCEPCLVARQIALIARTFNRFYAVSPILSAPADVRRMRLALTEAVGIVIRLGMDLLGIQVPERM